jgi:hypothetical protein
VIGERACKKEKVAELLCPIAVPMKPASKMTKKVRGYYQNWFTPKHWPLIFTTVKQHRNIPEALGFLRSAYRKPGDLSCIYDNLNRSTMIGWFHSDGTLKDGIKRCVELGNYFAKPHIIALFLLLFQTSKKKSMRFCQSKGQQANLYT